MFFFFNDTATTEIYTLSLHDALPIWDILPRAYGRGHPASLAYRFSGLLFLVAGLGRRTGALLIEEPEEGDVPDEDEEEELKLISSVLEFSDTLVREVMIPRPDMVTIDQDETTDKALDIVIEDGFSKIGRASCRDNG